MKKNTTTQSFSLFLFAITSVVLNCIMITYAYNDLNTNLNFGLPTLTVWHTYLILLFGSFIQVNSLSIKGLKELAEHSDEPYSKRVEFYLTRTLLLGCLCLIYWGFSSFLF